MSVCLYAAGQVLACLAAPAFSLEWMHSIEKTPWIEHWQVQGPRMMQTRAFVKATGAGMEPGEHAVLRNGWYEWEPRPQAVASQLELANFGSVAGHWLICPLPKDSSSACMNTGHFKDLGVSGFTLKPGLQNEVSSP